MEENACTEDPRYIETRKTVQAFERRFKLYIIFSILYGLIFVNYIDIIVNGGGTEGYHLWLVIMYFFPFIALTIFFPKNWQLTLGLGLIVSLMNDVFYGVVRNFMGIPMDLGWYYSRWLIPGDAVLFNLNLGFATIQVTSWMMALTIYARIAVVVLLLRSWKAQAKIRCLNNAASKKKRLKLPQWTNNILQKLGLTN